ncbi:MAG TPA: adenylate/guanylate cyclase domain-containing protein [Tepidisphaeraceae bacterium]
MLQRLRTRPLSTTRKLVAVFNIATVCTLGALLLARFPPFSGSVELVDTALYDAFYKQRTPESRADGPIVIIAVDQQSIDKMAASENHYRWPWPREYWGAVAAYLEKCGAKAIVFDLLFEEPSNYNNETGDDGNFGRMLDAVRIPVIQSCRASASTTQPAFAPKVSEPQQFGAVNVIEEAVVRRYAPLVGSSPSLAVQAVHSIGREVPAWADKPFYLHYYGPNKLRDGTGRTFAYQSAADVVAAALPGASPQLQASGRDIFRDRIVLIGATADATQDLKGSPVSRIYPGVEAHATAIENLLQNRKVDIVRLRYRFLIAWFAALLAAGAAILLRPVLLKLPASLAVSALLFVIGYGLFVWGRDITWLPLAAPLLATAGATVVGMTWTYLVEDRRRRTLLKFLAQFVSPNVAAELNRRGAISLGGVRREMTVMFTDIAGFTDLSEMMPVEKLEQFMNLYLSEMSSIVFGLDGTLDKYIGDSIMSFWNAPLDQRDHAQLACRAAIGLRDRERTMRPKLNELGINGIFTRIGINSGPMVVGNLGSEQKINYTVLGDAVNLASRLESANKIYGTQILVAEPTVGPARSQFLFRKLDLLRVKGRRQPMPVYELMAEGNGDARQQRLATEFEAALNLYHRREWAPAQEKLVALTAEFADDVPTRVLLERVQAFLAQPPPANWDGVFEAKVK